MVKLGFVASATAICFIWFVSSTNVSGGSDHATREQLVQSFLEWKPSGVADADNPFRQRVLSEGEAIVEVLLAKADQTRPLDNRVVWILGEIGSPRAFPFLLSEYLLRPTPRVAISLGSSLDVAGAEYLFANKAMSEEKRVAIISEIFGSQWPQIKDKKVEELRENLIAHIPELVNQCKKRSRPIRG